MSRGGYNAGSAFKCRWTKQMCGARDNSLYTFSPCHSEIRMLVNDSECSLVSINLITERLPFRFRYVADVQFQVYTTQNFDLAIRTGARIWKGVKKGQSSARLLFAWLFSSLFRDQRRSVFAVLCCPLALAVSSSRRSCINCTTGIESQTLRLNKPNV